MGRDIKLQRFWGHDLDLLGLRDVISHMTIGLHYAVLGGPLKPSLYLASLLRYYVPNKLPKHIDIENASPFFVFIGAKLGLQHFATFCL